MRKNPDIKTAIYYEYKNQRYINYPKIKAKEAITRNTLRRIFK